MQNSWEWVRQHKRRERFRKRFVIVSSIVTISFLLFTFGVPPLFRFESDDQNDTRAVIEPQQGNDSSSAPAQKKPPVLPATDSVPKEIPRVTAVNHNDPVVVMSPADGELDDSDETDSASIPRSPDPAAIKVAQRVVVRLQHLVEQIDGDDNRLERFGGDRWRQIDRLIQTATPADDPRIARDTASEALAQLADLRPEIDFAEIQEQTRGGGLLDRIDAIVQFRNQHPEYARLNQLEESLTDVPREEWLKLAAGELDNASPDDAGFAEGWLPVAGAWQLVGNDSEAREAIRRAREALPRMTRAERMIESTIEICQHESFDTALSEPLIRNAMKTCEQVSGIWTRGTYLANLAGLSRQLGLSPLSDELLNVSMAQRDARRDGHVGQRSGLIQQIRAASWTASPEQVIALCERIEKQKAPNPLTVANVYGYAAIAAARHRDRTQFLRAMFRAENTLAPVRINDYPEYLYAVRLAEANVLQRRWRAAVIIANNIPDPDVWASILFRVMSKAPQDVRCPHAEKLFTQFGDQRWACLACAAEAEHRLRSGNGLISLVEWTRSLPLASLRAAAYAGIARAVGTLAARQPTVEIHVVPPDISDTVSLVQAAEQLADDIDDPIDSAFVWLQVARTWNLLGKTTRYQEALAEIDSRLLDAWNTVWNERPPVKRSFNGGYIYTSNRHKKREQAMIDRIITCRRLVSAIQADLSDADGAMESCLYLANESGFQSTAATFENQNFLHLKALTIRLQTETGVGPDVFPFVKHLYPQVTRTTLAALSRDVPELEAALTDLIANIRKIRAQAARHGQPARGYAELALLHAKQGYLDKYRDVRRSAQSLISEGNTGSELKLLLATADANAGEFALAESNLVRGTLRWFGDASRPRSQLAVSLARHGEWQKAMKHADQVSFALPVYRASAWEAVAQARFQDESQPQDQLLEWVASLESPIDQAGGFCGLALAAEGIR